MTSTHSKPVRLALTALRHAHSGDWRKVEHQLGRLNTEFGPEGRGDALVAWCDTLRDHMFDGAGFDERIRATHWAVETGEVGAAPRESARWAGRIIEARVRGDLDAFTAPMGELNAIEDGFERGRWVGELIQMVVLTMASTPRGYATMGQESTR
jgi:hypothetical protein